MAEAIVETNQTARFYCHCCDMEFREAAHNYTCPYCCNGFIEELQEEEPINLDDWEDEDDDDGFVVNMIQTPAQSTRNVERAYNRNRQDGGNRRRLARSRIRPRTLTRLASSTLRPNVPFDLMQDLIINLGVGVNWGTTGNMQLFLGNPGDYAWGREGLDAIVTQLLNQMDSTGPPPLSRDNIDALPIVEVNDEQADSKMQCSVCWEQFVLNEKVRQLPCLHIYHENCIRPWLELHGTCPICRQNLGKHDDNNTNSNQDNNGGSSSSTGGANNAYNALRNYFTMNLNDSSSSSSLE